MDASLLVQRLTDLANRQRVAAVGFELDEVDATTKARADVLFELQVVLERGLSAGEVDEVRELLPGLQRAEARLAKVVGSVARALQPAPERVSTYGRRGSLRGR